MCLYNSKHLVTTGKDYINNSRDRQEFSGYYRKSREADKGKGGQYMVMQGDLIWGGEHTMQDT